VSSFGLNVAIRRDEHTRHQSETSISLSNDITLDVSIVVLAGPDESSVALDSISHQIVNESMLIPKPSLLELLLIILLVDLLKDIFESSIVSLQDGILGAQVKWIVPLQSVFETRMRKPNN
jgi:hypothetical protein